MRLSFADVVMNKNTGTDLEIAIKRYLTVHQEAADTAEGIAKWWLRNSGLNASEEETTVAMKSLIAQGLVQSVQQLDGRIIFSKRVKQKSVTQKEREAE